MRYAALLILLSGCSYLSTKLAVHPVKHTAKGIPYHIRADVFEANHDLIARWIDWRAEEWVKMKSFWGCGHFSDDELWEAAKSVPILIYPGHFIWGNHLGWNYYGSHIVIAIDNPPAWVNIPTDPEYKRLMHPWDMQFGLRHLPHEFTHTVLQDFHP